MYLAYFIPRLTTAYLKLEDKQISDFKTKMFVKYQHSSYLETSDLGPILIEYGKFFLYNILQT